MTPPFESFLLGALNREQKPSVKKTIDRLVNWRRFWNLAVGSGLENPDRFHLWPSVLRASVLCPFVDNNAFTSCLLCDLFQLPNLFNMNKLNLKT